jgi:hypothetical protein
MSPLFGMVCVQCGGPIAFKIAFKILGELNHLISISLHLPGEYDWGKMIKEGD